MQLNVRRTVVTGLIVSMPLFVTLWVVQLIFVSIEGVVSPVLHEGLRLLGLGGSLEHGWLGFLAPVLSVLAGGIAVYLIGLIGGNVLGRELLGVLDGVLLRVPVVRSIYSATRQFMDTFSQAQGRAFRRVVLVQYPRQGAWTLGLVTNQAPQAVAKPTGQSLVAVFLPTTPNPTSGWLVFVPDADLVDVAISVDDAFKLIISGGVLSTTQGPTLPAA